jgi:elongator complex protein 3
VPSACGGQCIFCPTAPKLPKSYTFNENTFLAASTNFSPSAQLYNNIGKWCIDKSIGAGEYPLEIIILGGSFSALSYEYRRRYVSEIYSFLSNANFESALGGDIRFRCAVLTVESRPDQISRSECEFLREIGVTKVEIGVQHTDNDILKNIIRGHDQSSVIFASQILKDSGFKLGYHVMLGLPGAKFQDDLTMLSSTLWKPNYSPDYLKIYPCVLLRNVSLQPRLHELYRSGAWQPKDRQYYLSLIRNSAKHFPEFVRISRIQRQFRNDEMMHPIGSGLRNELSDHLNDISKREAGNSINAHEIVTSEISFRNYSFGPDEYYEAYHLSIDKLLAIGRLRVIDNSTAILRELKVFGWAAPIGGTGQVQGHRIGSKLLRNIEIVLIGRCCNKLYINSSVGARSFFLKHGYTLNDKHFMDKELR